MCNCVQCLDINMDVDYDGGFTLGVDVMLPFNKQAFISITLRRLCGRARLQLTRFPYTHWSFSFLQVGGGVREGGRGWSGGGREGASMGGG